LWGKARSYFESSLAIAPSAEAYADNARLLEQLGENSTALQKYREGLMLILNG
jgi:HemY protein